MSILWCDFETRSRCNLLTAGAYNYSLDASTDVLCLSYAFDDEDVQTWVPGQPFPDRVKAHTGQIRAHNAAFERLIFTHVLNLMFLKSQFYCTAAQARANCAPGKLEDVGRFASSEMRKDYRGAQLIRALSIPRADGTFNEDPALMAEMIAYCEQDVRTMRAISKAMRDMTPEEQRDYHINEAINDRGVLIDLPLAKAAVQYAEAEKDDIQALVAAITEGAVTSVRSPKMRAWVQERLGPEARKLMTVYKDGEPKQSIDKTVRASLLAMADDQPDEVPPHVADVIQCADDLWSSSVAKFTRMAELADVEDQRVRGAFLFNGGAATGRASSMGLQVHNFTRKCAGDPEAVRHAMTRGHALVPEFGPTVNSVLKSMLRPAIIAAPGKSLVVADWNSIEARLNPWLSADFAAGDVLDVFRYGGDIYVREAAKIFHCHEEDVTPEQRQIGKVAVLSCGYGGGVGAFAAMGRNYGVYLPESDARRIVDAWRRANPWAVRYWQALEEAFTAALRHPNHEIRAGRVTYLFDRQHLWYMLPSGRILCYPYARLEEEGVTYAKSAWKPAADAKEWPRARLWRGLACENICQAGANDVLRNTLRQLDDVVLHVHDEVVLETAEPDEEHLRRVMCKPPEWCDDLPLAVDIKIMQRYAK